MSAAATSVDFDDRIVALNVGGEPITTRLSTLCSCLGSALEAFATRWFDGTATTLQTTEQPHFLDRDPAVFRLLLNCLRTPGLAASLVHETATSKPENCVALKAEAEFWGLTAFLQLDDANEHPRGSEWEEVDLASADRFDCDYEYSWVVGAHPFSLEPCAVCRKSWSTQCKEARKASGSLFANLSCDRIAVGHALCEASLKGKFDSRRHMPFAEFVTVLQHHTFVESQHSVRFGPFDGPQTLDGLSARPHHFYEDHDQSRCKRYFGFATNCGREIRDFAQYGPSDVCAYVSANHRFWTGCHGFEPHPIDGDRTGGARLVLSIVRRKMLLPDGCNLMSDPDRPCSAFQRSVQRLQADSDAAVDSRQSNLQ